MVVSDLIKSAFISLRKVPPGGGVPTSWTAMALTELNAMLQLWAVEGLHLHALTTSTPKTLTVGDPIYTIGTSGDINNRRPVEIVAAKVALSGTEYPLVVYNSILRYQHYSSKTAQGRPSEVYYDADFASALATVWLYPTPDQAYALTLYSLVSLAPFATAGETVALPPEYEMPLSINLAARMMPTFGMSNVDEQKTRDAEIMGQAKAAKAALMTNNVKRLIREARFDAALLTTSYGSGGFNIQTG